MLTSRPPPRSRRPGGHPGVLGSVDDGPMDGGARLTCASESQIEELSRSDSSVPMFAQSAESQDRAPGHGDHQGSAQATCARGTRQMSGKRIR